MKRYEINDNTLAVIPFNKYETIVYEGEDSYILEKSVSKIMDESCKYYGSTLEGRQKGTSYVTGLRYKAPIIVSEDNNIVFFPTSSPRLKDCGWISLNNIKEYYAFENKMILVFMNNQKIEIEISEYILKNQILRAAMLDSTIRKRKIKR